MPQATRKEVWDAPIEKIFEVITKYEDYPEFVDGCSSTRIISREEGVVKVEFGLNLIKKFKYILILNEEHPRRVSWTLDSGDIFKKNEGSWEFTDLGDGRTEVCYALEVEIKGFAPKAIVNGLTEKNLPAMLKSYHQRCKA